MIQYTCEDLSQPNDRQRKITIINYGRRIECQPFERHATQCMCIQITVLKQIALI